MEDFTSENHDNDNARPISARPMQPPPPLTTTATACTANNKKRPRSDSSSANAPLPFDFFPGATIYRNRLHSGETLENGHVSLSNLILPGCSSVLITTFEPPDPVWLESLFDDAVEKLIVVTHDQRGADAARTVGNAEMVRITPRRPDWYWILAKPHTNGCLHGKLLLFRSNQNGLRVVVSGNNFFQDQWETDRDCLWVQDFGFGTTSSADGRHCVDYSEFGNRLRSFLNDMTSSHGVVKTVLDGIDFSKAKGRLVVSFPRPSGSKADRGGYRQLATAVDAFLCELDPGSDYGSDNDDEQESDEAGGSEDVESRVAYAMAGSFGDLLPDFILQMQQALQGKYFQAPKETSWDQVGDGLRCLWPSCETALTMNLMSLIGRVRPMPRSHWDTIPEHAKRHVFFDAPPNPKEMGLPHLGCAPISHAKVLYSSDIGGITIVYVGSHNFSKAAWGLRGVMPRNVEIGVVLGTKSSRLQQQWQDRLPCALPSTSTTSPANYIPASAHDGVREALMQGRQVEAIKMLKEWLGEEGDKSPNNVTAVLSQEVIDLCDSD